MSLIFCDGFDHYNTPTQKWNISTGNTIGAGQARNGTGGLSQGGNQSQKTVLGSQEHATFILGCAVKRGSPTGTFEMRFQSDTGATTHVTVQITSVGEIKVFRGTVAGTQLGSTVSANIAADVWYYIEAKVVLNDTTGSVVVKLNGVQVFSATSQDTKNAGTKTVFDSIGLAIANVVAAVDDVYLLNGAGATNNDFLGDIKIETLYPNGNGNSSALTGSDGNSVDNYLLVDETPPNTSDYNGSATDNLTDTYTMGNLTTSAGTIYGAVFYAYAAKNDAGTKGGAIIVRSAGTDYEQTDNALATSYTYYKDILETDPATAAAWTITNINAVEAGWKTKAS